MVGIGTARSFLSFCGALQRSLYFIVSRLCLNGLGLSL